MGNEQQGPWRQSTFKQSGKRKQPSHNSTTQCHQCHWEAKGVIPGKEFFSQNQFKKGKDISHQCDREKLAMIIWSMVVKDTLYINPEGYLFLDQKREIGLVKRVIKQIDKFAFTDQYLSRG